MSKSNVKKTIVSDLGDNMLKEMLENVKRKSPLVHNIYKPYMIKSHYTTNKNVPLMVEYYFVYSNTRRD